MSVTSPVTKLRPPTVTVGLVSAVPSYGWLAVSDVSVTGRGLIVSLPFTVASSSLATAVALRETVALVMAFSRVYVR